MYENIKKFYLQGKNLHLLQYCNFQNYQHIFAVTGWNHPYAKVKLLTILNCTTNFFDEAQFSTLEIIFVAVGQKCPYIVQYSYLVNYKFIWQTVIKIFKQKNWHPKWFWYTKPFNFNPSTVSCGGSRAVLLSRNIWYVALILRSRGCGISYLISWSCPKILAVIRGFWKWWGWY